MSMRQVPGATFRNFGAPVYPEAIVDLAAVLTAKSSSGMSGIQLDYVVSLCTGFRAIWPDAQTDDGYQWLRVAEFEAVRGVVLVAFPRMGDASGENGVRCDRAPAAYLLPNNGLTIQHANDIVRRLVRVMERIQGV